MSQYLTQESFNRIWSVISNLYPTANAIQGFMVRSLFKLEKVQLQGTGENMVYSLLSLAEKENRVDDIVETALGPNEFPNNADLKAILTSLQDKSAYLPDVAPASFISHSATDPVKVVLVYDQKDHAIVADLNLQLYPLDAFLKSISIFDMHLSPEVSGGSDAKKVIDKKLEESQIVLLLLTPRFIGNPANDCARLAVNAFQLRKRVIPVLLEPCMWDRISMLESIVPLPVNRKFVSQWGNKDQALLDIANGVGTVADAIKNKNT